MSRLQLYFIKNLSLFVILFIISCAPEATNEEPADERPNILWLVAEDLSPIIPPFGDSTVQTPNLSRLAAEGVRYSNVFSVSGVCSPSRACLATGMYPTSIGAHHMRTLKQQPEALEKGLIPYEVVLPLGVKMVSEIMRANGYYCTNNSKTDYQFQASKMAWDESSVYAHWRNGPLDQPFFSIFNFFVTHEGQTWAPQPPNNYLYPRDIFPPERNQSMAREKMPEGTRKPLSIPEDTKVPVPPYLPTTPKSIQDVRRVYSNIVEMDEHVGKILDQLEADGELDNTIIVWYSDHGGPLPRQKRLCYDSGLKVPMIIRYPNKWKAGEMDNQLISFVDFAPTLLSMANIEPPQYMQGQAFTGVHQSKKERTYVHAAGDRFDEHYDMIRAVRDQKYKYLKNYRTEQPYYLPVAYREQMGIMQELLRLRDEGKLTEVQKQWFRTKKPLEELFDTEADPHEVNNLVDDPAYSDKLLELRIEAGQWWMDIKDLGHVEETALINQFWPSKTQPQTLPPDVVNNDGIISLSNQTAGASIGYKKTGEEQPWLGWNIYDQAIRLVRGDTIRVLAHRVGYKPSEVVIIY